MQLPILPPTTTLPDYVAINSAQAPLIKKVLRTSAEPFTFPLSDEDCKIIAMLVAKYDNEVNIAGLAAPQIGFAKQAIVFAVADDPELKKWRPDLTQTIPKTIWLNPSYEAIGEDTHEDYEACFSVLNLSGPVKRYKTIRYQAYDLDGQLIEGIATGFLARVIQHETDHIHGKLFIDYVAPEKLISIEEYRQKRQHRIDSE